LRNNIVLQLPGEIYLDGNKGQITGEHNLWFGAGNAPSQTGENISADPDFVNAAAFSFHLSAKSPAKDAGVKIQPANPFSVSGAMTDKDGVVRPQGKEFDLGAYELPLQSK
jgi:hypothetical protein